MFIEKLKKNLNIKVLLNHLLLLIFLLLFVGGFEHIFGIESMYIASFSITAILMFSSISLNLPKNLCVLLFPILFLLSVLLPYLITICHNIIIGSFIIILSVILFLFFLGPSLQYQSYVPFLFLYALNINSPVHNLKAMVIASLIGGIFVSIVYYLSHKKEESYNINHQLMTGFKNHMPFIIKIIIGMVLAYIISYYINDLKTSWIIVTVVSLTELDIQNTQIKLSQRIIATVIGIVLYSLFLMKINTHFPSIIPLLLVVIAYIYTFLNNYFFKMIFVTFNSLNAAVATLRLPTEQMIVSRLIFVIIGAIITFIITYIFHYLYSKLIKKSNE